MVAVHRFELCPRAAGESMIDSAFVTRWGPRYGEKEGVDDEYAQIKTIVSQEMRTSSKAISRETFERIVHWKAPRLLGKGWVGRQLQRGSYKEHYAPAIKACLKAPSEDKIFALEAPGIGAPVASTILHFMYPTKLPIMDVRTVEVLNHYHYFDWKTRSRQNYQSFTKTMIRLRKETGYSLRTIDRALFAFHKIQLRPHGINHA